MKVAVHGGQFYRPPAHWADDEVWLLVSGGDGVQHALLRAVRVGIGHIELQVLVLALQLVLHPIHSRLDVPPEYPINCRLDHDKRGARLITQTELINYYF